MAFVDPEFFNSLTPSELKVYQGLRISRANNLWQTEYRWWRSDKLVKGFAAEVPEAGDDIRLLAMTDLTLPSSEPAVAMSNIYRNYLRGHTKTVNHTTVHMGKAALPVLAAIPVEERTF